jgi:Holliday junction DNA helicase RuvA
MISCIQGRLLHKSPDEVIIDVHGVGYGIMVPLSTFYELPEVGDDVTLLVHTYVREDTLHLFGFSTAKEKSTFRLLIGISGVGPRLALNILSGISAPALEQAVWAEDLPALVRIPGVGAKTAKRMLLELKDKIAPPASEVPPVREQSPQDGVVNDALSALANLGYRPAQAEAAVKQVLKKLDDDLSIEALLKESLRILVRH